MNYFFRQSVSIITVCSIFFTPVSAWAGMVAFFDVPDSRSQCPEGWQELQQGKGRLVQGTTNANDVGKAIGSPMQTLTPPTHSHGFTAGVKLSHERVIALGGPNHTLTSANVAHHASGTSGASDGNLPYMQMLLCEQVSGEPAEDMLAKEMVAFFNNTTCPDNWELYEKMNGRFGVPIPPDAKPDDYNKAVGSWPNNPMTHDHYMYVSDTASSERVYLPVSEASVALAKDSWPFAHNNSYGHWRFADQSFSTARNTTEDIPRISMLVCRKATGRARSSRLPEDIMAFMTAEDCPNHWRQKPASMGRFLVGLPEGQYAQSGVPFGGNPLSSGEIRQHTHSVLEKITLPGLGIAGANGCCSGDYAAAGEYTMQGELVSAPSTLPYVQMRHCIVTPKAREEGSGEIRQ